MTLGFGAGPREASCRFCARSVHPELLSALQVPYLRQPAFEVCPSCREDYQRSGVQLRPFTPSGALPGRYLWPGPRPADLEGADADGELRAGLDACLEGYQRLARLAREEEPIRARLAAARPERPLDQLWLRDPELARLAFGVDPELEGLLRAAWEALDEFLPSYAFETPLHAAAAVLLARLTLELGERAPRAYGPRKAGPAAWLEELRGQARQKPALRDPRLPLLRALLYREEDHLSGADKELHTARAWLDAAEDAAPWRETRLAVVYDLHLRALDAERWVDARGLLKEACALAPDAPQLFLRLARAYLRCAQPEVAREVLAAQLGASRVTPAKVDEHVAGSLQELRPLLESRQTAHPEEPLRILYAACLLGLGEHDAAWRALDGDALTDLDAPEPEQAERLHLAGRIAHGRGDLPAAARLLARAFEAAQRTAARGPVLNDLLYVLLETARELLDDLEQRTRAAAERRDELLRELTHTADPELRDELGRLRQELAGTIRGGPADDETWSAAPGLDALHALIRAHADVLLAATTEHERDVFTGFLGRELGAGLRPLVTPPALTDRGDLRVSDGRLRVDLTYLALAKRRLPDAVREDRAARGLIGHGAPLHPLLTYLELLRRGGAPVQAWASWAWSRLPIRRAPIEVGLLVVSAEELAARDVARLASLFDEPGRGPTAGRPSLRSLQHRCQLVLPRDAAPHTQARDPEVRAFVRALADACPAFPFVLDLDGERGQLELYLGALASPDALQDEAPHLNLLDASALDPARATLRALRALAPQVGLDPTAVCQPLLDRYPPERRDEL